MASSSLRGGILVLCGFAVVSAGCLISTPEREPVYREPSISHHLAPAQELYQAGRYEDALMKLVEIGHRHPQAEGLDALRYQVMTALTESREQHIVRDSELSRRRINLDADRLKVLPQTYGMRRFFPGETGSLRTASGRAQQMLERPVTFNRIEDMTLGAFLFQIAETEGINLVADDRLLEEEVDPRTITVHADQEVMLHEILDYVGRNFNVAFYAGENLIWATERPADEPDAPLETRLYRLRKGASGHELEAESLGIERAIARFVTPPEGFEADEWWLFDRKAHVLIVRNTRENLAQVENIIEHLDVCPLQISIEARFITSSVGDMQELGIDWLLHTPLVTSRKTVSQDGRIVDVPRTKIDSLYDYSVDPPRKQSLISLGAPKSGGLNLSYHGILTEPQFEAILHALHLSDKSRTISAPKVTTINNQRARVWVGEKIPYFEGLRSESVRVGRRDGEDIYETRYFPDGLQWLEPGFELIVTPTVGADLESIALQLTPEISEFMYWETFGSGDAERKIPVSRHRIIETEVIVRSGETVVMGGLITQSERGEEEKVPFISSIPLLGHLFRRDRIEDVKEHLLIFVTAQLISQRGEALLPVEDINISREESIRREFFPVSVQRETGPATQAEIEASPRTETQPQPPDFDALPEE